MTVRFDAETIIRSAPGAVFAASLDIDAHLASMEASGETAIAGVTSGLIGLHETVTWRAKHFGRTWTMTTEITELDAPRRFVDEQLRGPFRFYRHEHLFVSHNGGTRMIDHIAFAAPFRLLGRFAEWLFLRAYIVRLISRRNSFLRDELERVPPSKPGVSG
jgi:ligand-binding SRPBCC domain-containing protein